MPKFLDLLVVHVTEILKLYNVIPDQRKKKKKHLKALFQFNIYHHWPVTATSDWNRGSWYGFLALNILLAEL